MSFSKTLYPLPRTGLTQDGRKTGEFLELTEKLLL